MAHLVLFCLLMIRVENTMKTGTQIKVDNHTQTVIIFSDCGSTTSVKAGIDTKTARDALQRPCGSGGLLSQFVLRKTNDHQQRDPPCPPAVKMAMDALKRLGGKKK